MMNYNANTDECPICHGLGFVLEENNCYKPCECREKAIMEQRLKFACIPEKFKDLTVSSFDTNIYGDEKNNNMAKIVKRAISKYIDDFENMSEKGVGIYLFSKTKGSGKTRLAISLGNALIKHKNKRVRFITTPDLLGHIKATFNKDSTCNQQELIEEFSKVPVLILDDIGAEKVSNFVDETLFNILDKRLTGKKVTIFTSNYEIDNLPHDERIRSRLHEMTCPIPLPEIDARKKIASYRNAEFLKSLLG